MIRALLISTSINFLHRIILVFGVTQIEVGCINHIPPLYESLYCSLLTRGVKVHLIYLAHIQITRKNKFNVYVLIENPSLEMQQLLYRSDWWYNKTKAKKEMAVQVLLNDLPHGDMDGDIDPPSLNAEIYHFDNSRCRCCHHIVSSKNLPLHHPWEFPPYNLVISSVASYDPTAFTYTLNRFRGPKAVPYSLL